jgi:Putative zinc-finger
MREHESIRELLPLSAVGVLDASDERRVQEHVRDCAQCAAALEELAMLAGDVGSLPVPPVSADLAVRTQALIATELAIQADRRQAAVLASIAAVCGWGLALVPAYFYQAALGGSIWIGWFWCAAAGLLGAPAAVALQRSRRRAERSAI